MPLYIAGAKLVELYSTGPILEGIGLNITVWSYLGTLYFGLISCRELMPDLWDLAELLPQALDELIAAAAPDDRRAGARRRWSRCATVTMAWRC